MKLAKSLLFSGCLLLSSANAVDVTYFIDAGFGKQFSDVYFKVDDGDNGELLDTTSSNIEVIQNGVLINNVHRLYLELVNNETSYNEYDNVDYDIDGYSVGFGYQYTANPSGKFRPLMGFSYNIIQNTIHTNNIDNIKWDKKKYDIKIETLSSRVGFQLNLNNNIYLTTYYDTSFFVSGKKNMGFINTDDDSHHIINMEYKRVSKCSIGLGYKF